MSDNVPSHMKIVGSSSHTDDDREPNDFYATGEMDFLDFLIQIDLEKKFFLSDNIWEPACGEGNLCTVLKSRGHNVRASDIIDRGYGDVLDFLSINAPNSFDGDIITNPPYRNDLDMAFIRKALDTVKNGRYVIMLFKTIFLASKKRYLLFNEYRPRFVYTYSRRIRIMKNNKKTKTNGNALDYSWFVWQKGVEGEFQNVLITPRDWR